MYSCFKVNSHLSEQLILQLLSCRFGWANPVNWIRCFRNSWGWSIAYELILSPSDAQSLLTKFNLAAIRDFHKSVHGCLLPNALRDSKRGLHTNINLFLKFQRQAENDTAWELWIQFSQSFKKSEFKSHLITKTNHVTREKRRAGCYTTQKQSKTFECWMERGKRNENMSCRGSKCFQEVIKWAFNLSAFSRRSISALFVRTLDNFCVSLIGFLCVVDFTSGCGWSFLAGWSDKSLNTKMSLRFL